MNAASFLSQHKRRDPAIHQARHPMKTLIKSVSLGIIAACSIALAADWPTWRGPNRNGVAEAQPPPPVVFSDSTAVRWRIPVPGRGHGSPAVAGYRIFLQTADDKAQTQSVLCFDRSTGRPLWSREIHRGGFPQSNAKASHASCTPACDGDRVSPERSCGFSSRPESSQVRCPAPRSMRSGEALSILVSARTGSIDVFPSA